MSGWFRCRMLIFVLCGIGDTDEPGTLQDDLLTLLKV